MIQEGPDFSLNKEGKELGDGLVIEVVGCLNGYNPREDDWRVLTRIDPKEGVKVMTSSDWYRT